MLGFFENFVMDAAAALGNAVMPSAAALSNRNVRLDVRELIVFSANSFRLFQPAECLQVKSFVNHT